MSLESFILNAQDAGLLKSEGGFTLNTTAADRKMSEMYRALPHFWPLKLLQSAACLDAIRVDFRTTREGFSFSSDFLKSPAPLSKLNKEPGEQGSYLWDALQILKMTETAMESLVVLQWQREGEGACWHYRNGREAQIFSIPEGAGDKIARMSGWVSDAPFHMILELKLATASWWSRLKNRLRITFLVKRVLSDRASYSPLSFLVDGRPLGQGVDDTALGGFNRSTSSAMGFGLTDLQNEMAAEYLLGPRDEDVFVRLRNPGQGSVFLRAFHGEYGPLGPQPRVSSKWTRPLQHPCFPDCPEPSLGWFRAPPKMTLETWQKDQRFEGVGYTPVVWLDWVKESETNVLTPLYLHPCA